MLEALFAALLTSLMIFGIGFAFFRSVNRRKLKTRIEIDPETGEEIPVEYLVGGTRRSRWRGYCCIGGAVLGYQLFALPIFFDAARTGKFNSMTHTETAVPGAFVGFFFGLLAGSFSSLAISDQPPPKKEED